MLDRDLAELYDVSTTRLNEQVKRNKLRFPENFMFQLTELEMNILKSQFATSSLSHGGRRYLPYAFTEQGVSMLSGVLRSETAIKISIIIISAFVSMRKFLYANASIFLRLDSVERKQTLFEVKTNERFEKVFQALDTHEKKQGIFYDGQIFDAYKFISDLIRSAKTSIILIDNYIDDSILTLFSKRKKDVLVIIYTKHISRQLKLDLEKYNSQYPLIKIKEFKESHDRFLILDKKDIYHIGASIKDLGKKWFAFSKIKLNALEILNNLK